MEQIKKIFVTGATGNQGGAVVRSLLKNGFTVKALTRNPSSPAAQKLKELNAEIIRGDLNDTASYLDQIRDIHGIFSVQTFENGTNKEINQGINLANMAKASGIKYFLYSSLIGADLHTGIPHWESKYIIENHIRQIGLPFCIIRPASFFENFLIPDVKKRILKGKLASPVNRGIIQPFISSLDIGNVSSIIFQNPDKYLGKTIPLVAEEMDMEKVSSVFSEALGKEIKYQKLPMFVTRLVMGKNLYNMFVWINKNKDQPIKNMDTQSDKFPNLLDLRQWIKIRFGDI
jgi:uncharacterized protein YbjT (DUF2867 family)